MLDATAVLVEHWVERLATGYRRTYGQLPPDLSHPLTVVARLAIERLSSSDALYHDTRHTLLVTAVGQAILRGRLMVEPVPADDWLHFTVATLLHDIGYVRDACVGDRPGCCVIDERSGMVEVPRGASDAFLTPYHVDRGKLFVRHRCAAIPAPGRRAAVPGRRADAVPGARGWRPCRERHRGWPRPCRGPDRPAGRSGLSAPAGCALSPSSRRPGPPSQLGYANPADLAERYPSFFWSKVEPYLGHGPRAPRPDRRGPTVDRPPLRPRLRRGAQAPAAGAGPAIARLRC